MSQFSLVSFDLPAWSSKPFWTSRYRSVSFFSTPFLLARLSERDSGLSSAITVSLSEHEHENASGDDQKRGDHAEHAMVHYFFLDHAAATSAWTCSMVLP